MGLIHMIERGIKYFENEWVKLMIHFQTLCLIFCKGKNACSGLMHLNKFYPKISHFSFPAIPLTKICQHGEILLTITIFFGYRNRSITIPY